MHITLVVAMTPERLIGAGAKLPWHLPEDLKHFRAVTTGHTVVMGRKTFDSIGKALPKRRNIVVTRNPQPPAVANVEWVASVADAIALARAAGEQELCVVGGSQIYAAALPLADRMCITYVHVSPPPVGDTYFPVWNAAEWKEQSRQVLPQMEIVSYERVVPS